MAEPQPRKKCPICEEFSILPVTDEIRSRAIENLCPRSLKNYCSNCDTVFNDNMDRLDMLLLESPNNNTTYTKEYTNVEIGRFDKYVYKGRTITESFYGRVCSFGSVCPKDLEIMQKRTGVLLERKCPYCKTNAVMAKGELHNLFFSCQNCFREDMKEQEKEVCVWCNNNDWYTNGCNDTQLYLDGKLWPQTSCTRCGTLSRSSWETYKSSCAELGLCMGCNGKLLPYTKQHRETTYALDTAKFICKECNLVWNENQQVVGTGPTHCSKCNNNGIMPIVALDSNRVVRETVWFCRTCPKCEEIVAVDQKNVNRFHISPLREVTNCLRCKDGSMYSVMTTSYMGTKLVSNPMCFECGAFFDNGKDCLSVLSCECGTEYTTETLKLDLYQVSVRKCTTCCKYYPPDVELVQKHYEKLIPLLDKNAFSPKNPIPGKKVVILSPKVIPKPIQSNHEEGNCVVCMEEKACVVLLDCWHMCLCEICSPKFADKSCPMCRSVIKSMKRPIIS